MKSDLSELLDRIISTDQRYAKDAYIFVKLGLDFLLKSKEKSDIEPSSNHVSGKELLDAIASFGIKTYGPMAYVLLTSWGVKKSIDIGNIVFNMVSYGILGKSEDDSIEDFKDVYTIKEAFEKPFLPNKEDE